ncbi:MAG: AAA family ATPase [Akkermansiaceae bacterium]|nr:AAA family ATPase [Akkermansiaceae bacterium]
MIRKLVVEGITIFPRQIAVDFVPGINVIIGSNDSGKSHLLKLSYALSKWSEKSLRREFPETWAEEGRLRRHLLGAFGARELASLISRQRAGEPARVHASFQGDKAPLGCAEVAFTLSAGRESDQLSITTMPQRFLQENALYMPPREVFSLFPCYAQLSKRSPELLDPISRDLCSALEDESSTAPPPADELRSVQRLISAMLRGRVRRVNSRFELQRGSEPPLEMSLVAEGFKRPATLSLLIANGNLRPGSTLFWDEPEMNLNPAHLPLLCGIMLGLSRAGVQLILSTHSLFLLRELVIRLRQESHSGITRRFISLHTPPEPGAPVQVSAGHTPDEIGPLDSLEAEMEQADRYLRMPPAPTAPC